MTRNTIKVRVAGNIGQLADDGSTVFDGAILATEIDNRTNDLYLEELFPMLSNKYPEDFWQETYPQATYTATGTVDAASTGSTLVATSSIFDNSMLGFTVYNATDDESRTVTGYTSGTTLTVDSAIDDDWDGDTIYVLGNEYTLAGDAADFKEIVRVAIKYASSDTYFRTCNLLDKRPAYEFGGETYLKASPYCYLTTLKVNNIPKRAVGFLPFPDSYQGSFVVWYIKRPPSLGASDEPVFNIPGISEVLINGVTAWAMRRLKRWEEADRYAMLYEKGKDEMMSNYKPKSRMGSRKLHMRYDVLYDREHW